MRPGGDGGPAGRRIHPRWFGARPLKGQKRLLERLRERILHTPELAERDRIGSVELEQAVDVR